MNMPTCIYAFKMMFGLVSSCSYWIVFFFGRLFRVARLEHPPFVQGNVFFSRVPFPCRVVAVPVPVVPVHHQLLCEPRDRLVATSLFVVLVLVGIVAKELPLVCRRRALLPLVAFFFAFALALCLRRFCRSPPPAIAVQPPSVPDQPRPIIVRAPPSVWRALRNPGVSTGVEADLLQPLCAAFFTRRPTCQPSAFVVGFERTNTSLNVGPLPLRHPVTDAWLAPTFVRLVIANRWPDKAPSGHLGTLVVCPHQPSTEDLIPMAFCQCSIFHGLQHLEGSVFCDRHEVRCVRRDRPSVTFRAPSNPHHVAPADHRSPVADLHQVTELLLHLHLAGFFGRPLRPCPPQELPPFGMLCSCCCFRRRARISLCRRRARLSFCRRRARF